MARAALDHPDVALVATVTQPNPSGYTPDLLTPKPVPGNDRSVLDAQLETMAATSPERAALELTVGSYPDGRMPRNIRSAMEAGSFAKRAAAGLAMFWRAALADGWPAIRSSLESDLAYRADAMTRNGIGHMLSGLHQRLTFDGERLYVATKQVDSSTLHGVELVLTPTVLGWPKFFVQVCDPANAIIAYPARGLINRPAGRGQLAGVVGSSRALILADLAVPRSTAELSRRHGLAPATVSYHLGAMLRAGLVVRSRDGHHVRYRLSPHGQLMRENAG